MTVRWEAFRDWIKRSTANWRLRFTTAWATITGEWNRGLLEISKKWNAATAAIAKLWTAAGNSLRRTWGNLIDPFKEGGRVSKFMKNVTDAFDKLKGEVETKVTRLMNAIKGW